jgi:hypothetical protein
MSKETYRIPIGPTGQYDFQRNTLGYAKANAQAWGIPDTKLVRIAGLSTDYELKYALANNKNTQSPAATAARKGAWNLLEPELIDLYDHHLINNDAISIADKEALHIHGISGYSGSPAPAPISTPVVTLVSEEISVLHVVYSDSAAPGTHYKPANVAFCELNYKLGEPAPTGVEQCTERYNIARSHEGITFSSDQRGKMIYVYARWVNKNGKQGPWSGPVSALIP